MQTGQNAANYGANQAANAQLGRPIQRPLESIATATQRVNTAIVSVQDFLDRFNGGHETDVQRLDPATGPAAMPYAGELERLMSAIERLESRVSALNEIG